jgi:hypothetical protein
MLRVFIFNVLLLFQEVFVVNMRPLAARAVDILKMFVGEAALNASHPIKAAIHFLLANRLVEGDGAC